MPGFVANDVALISQQQHLMMTLPPFREAQGLHNHAAPCLNQAGWVTGHECGCCYIQCAYGGNTLSVVNIGQGFLDQCLHSANSLPQQVRATAAAAAAAWSS